MAQESKSNMYSKMRTYSEGNAYVRVSVLLADFLLLNLILLFPLYIVNIELPPYILQATKVSVFVMNIAMCIGEYFFHTIIDRRFLRGYEIFINVLKLTATQAFLSGITLRILSNGGGLFEFILEFFVVEFVVILLSRYIEYSGLKYLRTKGRNSRAVLFVGSDPALLTLYNTFMNIPSVGYKVIGYYADERMNNEPTDLKHLGSIDDLNKLMDKWDANVMLEPNVQEIFCSISHSNAAEVKRIVHTCDRKVIHFFYVPRAFEDYELRLKPLRVGNYVYYSTREEPLLSPGNRFMKRTFDICFSLVVCILLIPITLIVGIIIKLQSPGPIFFRQARTGFGDKTFYLYKFRSMHVNKDADTEQATKDDPRKFPFGNFMRKTNIDELPQFFNVLKGDMSIVGPRPHMLYHTETYGKLIDKYMVRLFCKPGITGWAQVTGYRGETKELWQMEGRVKRDIWYVEHWSIGLDFKIILMTIKSVIIPDKNAY